jgi:uncharacterized transporter YbjL
VTFVALLAFGISVGLVLFVSQIFVSAGHFYFSALFARGAGFCRVRFASLAFSKVGRGIL